MVGFKSRNDETDQIKTMIPLSPFTIAYIVDCPFSVIEILIL